MKQNYFKKNSVLCSYFYACTTKEGNLPGDLTFCRALDYYFFRKHFLNGYIDQLYIDSSSGSQMECLISLLKEKFGDCLINLTSFFFVIRTNLNVSADKHHFRNILILINGFLKCLESMISIDACLILNSWLS